MRVTWEQYHKQLIQAERELQILLDAEKRALAEQGLEMVHILHDEYEIRPIQIKP
jgi:hypothetical protein